MIFFLVLLLLSTPSLIAMENEKEVVLHEEEVLLVALFEKDSEDRSQGQDTMLAHITQNTTRIEQQETMVEQMQNDQKPQDGNVGLAKKTSWFNWLGSSSTEQETSQQNVQPEFHEQQKNVSWIAWLSFGYLGKK